VAPECFGSRLHATKNNVQLWRLSTDRQDEQGNVRRRIDERRLAPRRARSGDQGEPALAQIQAWSRKPFGQFAHGAAIPRTGARMYASHSDAMERAFRAPRSTAVHRAHDECGHILPRRFVSRVRYRPCAPALTSATRGDFWAAHPPSSKFRGIETTARITRTLLFFFLFFFLFYFFLESRVMDFGPLRCSG